MYSRVMRVSHLNKSLTHITCIESSTYSNIKHLHKKITLIPIYSTVYIIHSFPSLVLEPASHLFQSHIHPEFYNFSRVSNFIPISHSVLHIFQSHTCIPVSHLFQRLNLHQRLVFVQESHTYSYKYHSHSRVTDSFHNLTTPIKIFNLFQ